jgi:secreted trypsin-like serine protease
MMTSANAYEVRLINGTIVDKKDYPHIVLIKSNSGGRCTATIVGERAILTAAHCAGTNATVSFTTKGKTYKAKITRSKYYNSRDHDLSIGVTTEAIEDVEPASIGGEAIKNEKIRIFGYGCRRPGGSDGMDGNLRTGEATITGYSNLDMVSRKGAALCYGDSGGPAFQELEDGTMVLLGVNSKGNIRDTNYNTRTDLELSKDFFEQVADDNQIDICGVNVNC